MKAMTIGILSFRSLRLGFTFEEQRLAEATRQQGHEPLLIAAEECSVDFIDGARALWKGVPFPSLDVLVPRARFVENPDLHLSFLRFLEGRGMKVLNTAKAIARAKNKIITIEKLQMKNIPIPRTVLIYGEGGLESAARIFACPFILKSPFGTFGDDVYLIERAEQATEIVQRLWAERAIPCVLAQEFVEEAEGKDTRVFIVDGRVLASMERSAPEGDFRSNSERGGSQKVVEVSPEVARLAVRSVKVLGLDYAGVDIIHSKRGPLVLEVNANPGFKALEEVSGVNIAEAIVHAAVRTNDA